jgi:TrmH family RNA methyltransferase
MLSRNQVKYIRSLHLKKYREIHGEFIAEGSRLVSDLLESGFKVRQILAEEEWIRDHRDLLAGKTWITITAITGDEMKKITLLSSPGPVLAVVSIPGPISPGTGPEEELILMLDGIRDPGNFGTILRIADWFGIRQVICSEDCVELYNPKTVQATMGSLARVTVWYRDLPGYLSRLKPGVPIYGTFPEGENIYAKTLKDHGIVVIGSESAGISPGVKERITDRISIPFFAPAGDRKGHAESLNASMAAAIVCSEFRRRMHFNRTLI